MADESTVETTTTDVNDGGGTDETQTGAQTNDQGGEMQSGQGADLQADVESLKAALKKANSESAARRKKLEAYEEAERQRQEAELSETEKLNKKLAEVTAERDGFVEQMRTNSIRHAVEMTAATMQFHDPADAYALADLADVDVADDGKVSGVENALKALAKSKPHLVKSANTQADVNATNRTNGASGISSDEANELGAIYGVNPAFAQRN
jgi:hypothetical protein